MIKLIEGVEEANLQMESAAKGIHILTHLSSQTREGVFYASRKLLEIQSLYESHFNQRYVPEFLFIQYQNAVLKLKSLVQTGLETFSGPQFEGAEGDFQVVIHHCTRLLELLAAFEPSKTSFIIQSLGANRNFPTHEIKDASWSKASETYVLPDRFVVIAIKDGEIRHAETGKAIPENLKVGIDPTDETGFQHDLFGNLNVPEDLKWMVNYQEAKKVGMGITLPLKADEASTGFDQVFVLGLRSDNAFNGRNTLEKLFKNHRYDDEGMSFLNVGTATNNTGDSVQAYNSDDLDPEYAYQMEMMGPVYEPNINPKEYTDGQRLAKALGIRDTTFQHIEGSGNQEVSEALRMNQVLFPATLGLFMEDFLDKVFSYDVTERTREFAEKFVSARGMLPSLRIGTQPYGFLITSAFSKFKVKSIGKNRAKWYEIKRKNFLNDMKNYWQELAGEVAHVTKEVEDRQKNFLDVLGLHCKLRTVFLS